MNCKGFYSKNILGMILLEECIVNGFIIECIRNDFAMKNHWIFCN